MNDLLQWDAALLLELNDWGNQYVDLFFQVLTHKIGAILLYLYLLYFLFKQYGTRMTFTILVGVALVILFSDQLANVFKDGFERLRPFREPSLEGRVSKIDDSNGTYGFYSAHASNAMALTVYLWGFVKPHKSWLAWLLVVWALLTGYSRIYLGVHYPGDVLVGFFMGGLVGIVCYKLLRKYALSSKASA